MGEHPPTQIGEAMPRARRSPGRHDTQQQQFGDELRYWREKRGLSVADLARLIGKDRRTVSGAEDGRDKPSEAVVQRLEVVLNSGGLLSARYEALLEEKRQQRLLKATTSLVSAPDANLQDASVFVDETIADGTLMEPGARFTKTWTIRNAGSVPWVDRRLTRIGLPAGPGLITTPMQTLLPETHPGGEVTAAVSCIAPFTEGTSVASFRMTDSDGRLYFLGRYHIGLQAQIIVTRPSPISSPRG